MYRYSFTAENFGDEIYNTLEDKFGSDYYLTDSNHGDEEIQTMNKLEDPNLSPSSKTIDDFNSRREVLNQD